MEREARTSLRLDVSFFLGVGDARSKTWKWVWNLPQMNGRILERALSYPVPARNPKSCRFRRIDVIDIILIYW